MRRILIGLLLCFMATAAVAQSGIGKPQETYYQDDSATVTPRAIEPTNRMAVAQLEQVLQYDPKNVSARIQHARLMLARGQRQHAVLEFEAAIADAPPDSEARRQLHWNFGWALLRMGQAERAVQEWDKAARLHGGSPRWVPSTMALGLWVAGEKEAAIEYFVVAVRSDPGGWGSTRGLSQSIRDWHADDRAAMEALHAEWKRRIGGRD
jgi:tetratricopeptide (TPR) repeat protein